MEELFEVTSCYFPVDFTPVSSTIFHSFQYWLSAGCILGLGILGTKHPGKHVIAAPMNLHRSKLGHGKVFDIREGF